MNNDNKDTDKDYYCYYYFPHLHVPPDEKFPQIYQKSIIGFGCKGCTKTSCYELAFSDNFSHETIERKALLIVLPLSPLGRELLRSAAIYSGKVVGSCIPPCLTGQKRMFFIIFSQVVIVFLIETNIEPPESAIICHRSQLSIMSIQSWQLLAQGLEIL